MTTTVAALSERHLLQRIKELSALEHHLEVVVIDHLRELNRRGLYLTLGYSSLFDYAVRELGYSDASAWRRIKAMRLCAEVDGARERMRDGSLTLNAAAQLQHAFERQERKQAGGGGGAQPGRSGATARAAEAHTAEPEAAPRVVAPTAEPPAAPVLDSSARQELVEQAAGKSTRQVRELLAEVDPERHDPARPPRRRGSDRRAAGIADETSAPKDAPDPDAAPRPVLPAVAMTSLAKQAEAAARLPALPATAAASPAKVQTDSECRRLAAVAPPPAATSAPKVERVLQRPQVRGRGIPAAVKRRVWERDQGCCSYVDRDSGRRCGSRHLLQVDHIFPYALGGGAEPGNLRLLCAAHHRYRHHRPDRAAAHR